MSNRPRQHVRLPSLLRLLLCAGLAAGSGCSEEQRTIRNSGQVCLEDGHVFVWFNVCTDPSCEKVTEASCELQERKDELVVKSHLTLRGHADQCRTPCAPVVVGCTVSPITAASTATLVRHGTQTWSLDRLADCQAMRDAWDHRVELQYLNGTYDVAD